MKKLIFYLFFFPLIVQAQKSEPGNWIAYFGNKKLDEKWNLHHELQIRNYNYFGDLEQLLARVGIGYNLTEKHNLLIGYGYILSNVYDDQNEEIIPVNEHRIFQQLISKDKINRIGITHRYRFEQRFIESQYKSRFRYFLSLNVPINRVELARRTVYLSAYNEIFLEPGGKVYDRNRLYGGLGYVFSSRFRMELGYMNQHLVSGGREQFNILTFFSF